MGKDSGYPDLYATECVFWDEDAQAQVKDDIHTLIPYEFLDYEIECKGNTNEYVDLPLVHSLNSTKRDWMSSVGLNCNPDTVALAGLWGDSAVYHTRDSLFIILFNIISGVHHQRHWIAAFGKRAACNCGCSGRHTWDVIWRLMSWVFGIWQSGEYPSVRDDGTPFSQSKRIGDKRRARWAAGRRHTHVRCGCVQFRGDWSFMKSIVNLTGWQCAAAHHKRCCYKCLAGTRIYRFTEVGLEAEWRQTLLTHKQFLGICRREDKPVSKLFDIPGLELKHVTPDLMHCVCLGILQYCIGWVLLGVGLQGNERAYK